MKTCCLSWIVLSSFWLAVLAIPVQEDGEMMLDEQHVAQGHVKEAKCVEIGAKFECSFNASSYMECVSEGWAVVKNCSAGFVFDVSSGACVEEPVTTTTTTMSSSTSSSVVETENSTVADHDVVVRSARFIAKPIGWFRSLFNGQVCNSTNFCVNGICNEWSVDNASCICLMGFSGKACNVSINNANSTLWVQIISGSFNLTQYLHDEYMNGNKTVFNVSMFEPELQNMLDIAPKVVNVSYDEFVVRVVDQIWSEINPEGAYLLSVDFGKVINQSDAGMNLQKIRFYSKHVMSNFESRMSRIEQALDALASRLINSSIKLNAIQSLETSVKILPASEQQHVKPQEAIEVHPHVLVKNELLDAIRADLNKTVCKTNHLYKKYVNKIVNGSQTMANFTQEQAHQYMEKLHNSTVTNWNMVIEYGHKFFTYLVSGNQVSDKKVAKRDSSLFQGGEIKSRLVWKSIKKLSLD